MKVLILYFSTSGNTASVARMLATRLRTRNIQAELVRIASDREIFKKGDFQSFFRKKVPPHDMLVLGFPVYVDHLHYNIRHLISALPEPGNGWGRWAVPFITYGGISSGFALSEAEKQFRKSGRKTVAAMKICSFHNLSRRFKCRINEGKPGKEALPYVEELAKRIEAFNPNRPAEQEDMSKHLNYHTLTAKLKFTFIFREYLFHKLIFPRVEFHADKCVKCGTCATHCPVLRIHMEEKGPAVSKRACIHCGECSHHCPSEAVIFNMTKFEKIMQKGARGAGLLGSNEHPESAVYPIG